MNASTVAAIVAAICIAGVLLHLKAPSTARADAGGSAEPDTYPKMREQALADGVHSVTVRTADIENPNHPLFGLYAAGQNVITQYRLTQAN